MSKLSIFGLIGLCVMTFIYVIYLEKYITTLNYLPNSVITISIPGDTISPLAQNNTNCADFINRFGISSNELVNYINDQPESAVVTAGFKNLYGTVLGLTQDRNMSMFAKIDNDGKISDFVCEENSTKPNPKTDIVFAIPENDFSQLIRYRETLEGDQTATYMQNMTTKPPETKNIIMRRIQEVSY